MILSNISLVQFKNLDGVELELHPKINCFVGNNGEGKTNILDAVYYLTFCKSFLNPIDSQNIQHGKDFFVVQGDFKKGETVESVYCGIKKGQKKVFKKNKKEYEKLADHIGNFPLVVIAPSDSSLIHEGSDLRRKFMDGIISQYDKAYLDCLIQYNKALSHRNALLKYFNKERTFNQDQLDVWDDQLVKYGEQLHAKRLGMVNQLIPVFQKYHQAISGGKEEVELDYQSQLEEANFKELLIGALEDDQRRLFTTVGVHKDDLAFKIKGNPVKKFGSQGQQKSFLIALKLSQLEFIRDIKGIDPILLLDDVFDKLDGDRVEHLLALVNSNNFGQIFITDTHDDRMREILGKLNFDYHLFSVNNQKVGLI